MHTYMHVLTDCGTVSYSPGSFNMLSQIVLQFLFPLCSTVLFFFSLLFDHTLSHGSGCKGALIMVSVTGESAQFEKIPEPVS